MKNKITFWSVLFTIILSVLVFFIGYNKENLASTQKLYQVYLSGEKIGVIADEEALYKLIDEEQEELKKEYGVSKIYPPAGLKIVPVYTYNKTVDSINQIYELIKNKEPFTIEGYEVTIKNEKPIKIYLLNKGDLDVAIRSTVESFIDKENLDKYISSTQEKITDEGSIIDNVYLNQEVSIKKNLISTENKIFTNSDELSRYMLFGTLEPQSTYTVKLGDTIEKVADSHQLSPEEFLIVNPQIVSEKALLYAGQVVNINLIKPLIGVIEKETLVENQVIKYETTIEYDNSMVEGKKYVKQSGVNGLSKVTFEITKLNGDIVSTNPLKDEEISSPIDQIVVRGGRSIATVGDSSYWAWPTIRPYKISSYFGWRWGDFHSGVDIGGTGFGSPIYSIQNGVVTKTGYHSSMGNYIYVNHNNGYYSVYMHLSKILVSVGDTVGKKEQIAKMGNSGHVVPAPTKKNPTAGTHLHLGIFKNGAPYSGGTAINPLLLYK